MHPSRFLLLAATLLLAAPALAGALPPGDRPAPTPFSRLDDAGVADDHPGADHVVVLDEAVNVMAPSGVTTVDGYVLTKILTAAGCRDQAVLNWHYDPQSQWIEVREVNVLRDGARIPVDVSAVRDLPAPQSAIYWSDRVKLLQLPRLEVGDGVEVITWRKGYTYALLDGSAQAPDDERFIPPMPGEYFDIVRFVGSAKTLEKRYVLNLPKDKRLHFEVYNGALHSSMTYTDDRTEYAWWGFDIPARVREPRQPDSSDYVTKVVMATAESWEAKSRWFFDVNKDQFEVTPAIQEKVDEILAEQGLRGADADRKAKALLHWVAQNIRYSGQTMGEGEGFTLHPSTMIFEQRSGVCKDIAGMLVTMFRAAGLESNPAMTMAGSRIETVPADQFNHCVTALRLEDGTWRMYDPTWVPYNNAVWSFLETEQHYLIGSTEGETLSRIRYSPPEESPLVARNTAELNPDGTLVGRIRLDGTGALDGRLRGACNGRRDGLVDRWTRLLAHAGPRVEGVTVRHRVTDDFSGDMWAEIEYRIPGFARRIDGGLEFVAPLATALLHDGGLWRGGSATWAEERDTDLLLYFTQLLDSVERIQLPRGWKLAGEPGVESVDETYGAFTASAEMDGRTLVLTQRAEVRRRQIPPDGYAGFRAAMEAAREWGSLSFRVEKGGRR